MSILPPGNGSPTHASPETPPFQDEAPPNEGPSTSNTGGKYVPPSMRGGPGASRGPGESMRGTRDDLPTLRVTNISEDTQEQDLRDLFSYVGRVARVYVGRDRETGVGRGFAFVSFEDKATAQLAIDRMNGRGYDNLILNVGWSRKLFFLLPLYAFQDDRTAFHRTSGTALAHGRCCIRYTAIDACYGVLPHNLIGLGSPLKPSASFFKISIRQKGFPTGGVHVPSSSERFKTVIMTDNYTTMLESKHESIMLLGLGMPMLLGR